MVEAAKIGDVFVTVTGCCDVVTKEAFLNMKNGAICCNAGHFDVEVDVHTLKKIAKESYLARDNIMGYKLENGNTVYVIAEGRLVNLAAGDGHPAEIMDMSFAIQALSARYIADNRNSLSEKLITVPEEVDNKVAEMKLALWNVQIDRLTKKQVEYLNK